MSLLAAALTYARSGRRVHPCRPDDKRPLTRWGTAATTDETTIKGWWMSRPDALIGLCTGDGLVVVDDDRGTATPDSDLAATLTARTRSRGWHHYYFSLDVTVANAVGLLPGIDIRGQGGYVIAPPSPGWEYLDPDAPMLALPDFIRGAYAQRHVAPRHGSGSGSGSGFEPARQVAEGGRNDYIARFAGYAIRLGFEDEHDLIELCLDHNAQVCVPPLDDSEVRRTARSILRRHERGA